MSRLPASLYYGSLGAIGATALSRRLQSAGPILCYHNVVGDPRATHGERTLHMPCEQFERHMRWLSRHYDVLPLEETVERVHQGRSLRRAAAVTFDDAYTGVFEHAVPVLRALGIPATVFAVASAPTALTPFWWDHPDVVASMTDDRRQYWLTDLRGDAHAIRSDVRAGLVDLPAAYRPADWATIRAHLGNGISLGAHSATHRSLPSLSDDELQDEVQNSRVVLFRETGQWPELFAYPYGHWDARVHDAVRAAGYRGALALDAHAESAHVMSPWSISRLNIPAGISDAAFAAWVSTKNVLGA